MAAVLFMIGSIGLGILWQRGGVVVGGERQVGADQRAGEAGAGGAGRRSRALGSAGLGGSKGSGLTAQGSRLRAQADSVTRRLSTGRHV